MLYRSAVQEYMSSVDRLEMQMPPELKQRVQRAAEARGQSVTRFAVEALERAAHEVLEAGQADGQRVLGWAAGTASRPPDMGRLANCMPRRGIRVRRTDERRYCSDFCAGCVTNL